MRKLLVSSTLLQFVFETTVCRLAIRLGPGEQSRNLNTYVKLLIFYKVVRLCKQLPALSLVIVNHCLMYSPQTRYYRTYTDNTPSSTLNSSLIVHVAHGNY